MHSQQRRHQYLAALGVTSWLPRAELAGAKRSADWVHTFLHQDIPWDESDYEESALAEPTSHTAPAPVAKSAPVTAASLQLTEPSPSAARVAEASSAQPNLPVADPSQGLAPVALTARQTGTPVAPFRLCFWLFKELWVVDSMPHQGRGQQDPAYQRLCANLVRALGKDAALTVPAYTLTWPMLAGATLDQGLEQARIAVEHKLKKYRQAQPAPKAIVLLGEAAAQLVMQRDEPLDQLRGLAFSYASDINAIASLSLTEMLRIPECKRDVWHDLQPVYQG